MSTFSPVVFNVFLFACFFLHGNIVFLLIDNILQKPKFKRFVYVLMSALYASLALFLVGIFSTFPDFFYLCLFLFFTVTFLLSYHYHSIWNILMCSLAVLLHIMAIFSIVLALFSLRTGQSFYELLQSSFIYIILPLTVFILSLCTFFVRKIISAKYYTLITKSKDQSIFFVILLGLFTVYMNFNTAFFSFDTWNTSLILNQIVVSLVMMSGMYLGIVFLIRINILSGYKEKSENLEEELDRNKLHKSLMLSDTLITYELNCDQDILYKITEKGGKELLLGKEQTYSETLAEIIDEDIYAEDKAGVIEKLMPKKLIDQYEQGNDEIVLEYRRLQTSGTYGWVRTTINTAKDPKTGDVTAVILVKDIDLEKQNQLKLQYRAEHDPLTGAYNKRMVQKYVSTYLKEDRLGALLILDVDDFKRVNDQMGHMYGDAVLSKLVEIVKTTFRTEDIVGRVGGDEFIIFMRNLTSEFAISNKADALCKNIEKTDKWDREKECVVSCSVGVAIAPNHGSSFEELYHHADIALYISKRKGKNTFSIYDGSEDENIRFEHTSIDSEERLS